MLTINQIKRKKDVRESDVRKLVTLQDEVLLLYMFWP